MAQAERQTGSCAMGQHPPLWGPVFTKRKNKGTKYPLTYRAGLMPPPVAWGLWAGKIGGYIAWDMGAL